MALALGAKIQNPLPLLAETKSVLQSVCDHAQARDLKIYWSEIGPPTAFETKWTFFEAKLHSSRGMTITCPLGTLDQHLHKYNLKEHEKAALTPVMVTILDNTPEEIWVTTFWSRKATVIAGDRTKGLMNCQRRVLQDGRPRPRHSVHVGHLLPNLWNPGYFLDKDWKTVYTQDGSWEGQSLTADETRFVSELISTSWAQTHGMRVQQPLALMLSMKFCVSLPPEVGAAFGALERERHDKALQQRRWDTAWRWLQQEEAPGLSGSLNPDTVASSSTQQWLARRPQRTFQPTPQHAIEELNNRQIRENFVQVSLSDSSSDENECQYRSPYKGSYQ